MGNGKQVIARHAHEPTIAGNWWVCRICQHELLQLRRDAKPPREETSTLVKRTRIRSLPQQI